MEGTNHRINVPLKADSQTEDYQEILNNVLNYNSVGFVLLLAKEVGIMDTLLKAKTSMTSQDVAIKRGLKERYTREILQCLVCAKLVKASVAESGIYFYYIDDFAKKLLMSGSSIPDMQLPLCFMTQYENVKKCLPVHGPLGINYCDELRGYIKELADKMNDKVIDFLFEKIPDLEKRLDEGMRVLEFGSGSGALIGKLAARYTNSTFTASEHGLQIVQDMKNSLGHLPNMKFEVYDLSALPEHSIEKFDWILMKDATHVLPHPGESLKATRRLMAEPSGILTLLDFVGKGDPTKSIGDMEEAMNYTFSLFHCIPMSFQSEGSEAYGCCWSQETAITVTQEAGYDVKTYPFSSIQVLFVAKPM